MAREEGVGRLFETKTSSSTAYRLFSISMFIGILAICLYRISHITTDQPEKWSWILMLLADFWFGFYWVLTQAARWNPVYRYTSKHHLSLRHEQDLAGVDVFVCTADPSIEPPMMVINTVLSVMAYAYPTDKLSVYLSDDGASELTFYALLEASAFSKHWIPFCKKFNIEPRSPYAYFSNVASDDTTSVDAAKALSSIKRLYEEMAFRIETATKSGRLPEEIRSTHKGFSEWTRVSSRHDHPTVLQVLIDGGSPDITGAALPTLVYLAREKRPTHPHNFKAGAMNALIRVSSKISNGKFILNVDCDMYSNNSESIRDALCFFMDEQKGHEIAFVQFPQFFNNITKNDIYGSSMIVIQELELPGLDGYGGPLYIGTGCFHRRETLCGKKYGEEYVAAEDSATKLVGETIKVLADCNFEENTQWGKEMGLKYGCPVEDVITGLAIQSRGWKSVYFNPARRGFLGIAPTTLGQTLVQHKRWSEGDLQILLSKYGPLSHGTIKLGHKMGYCIYCLWAVNCLPTLCYSILPPIYLLKGIPLFPRISSLWFLPFAYVIIAEITQSVIEFIRCGGTLRGWWNEQRIWMFKRTTSYLFGFIDNIFKLFGYSNSAFDISVKVVDKDVSERYEKEMMEFGHSSPMFIILATLALINLFSLVGGVHKMVMRRDMRVLDSLFLQVAECIFVVTLNLPVYQALFFRKDNGRLPTSVAVKSIALALLACSLVLY